MTDQNLKNDANLTTNHQSDEATADKALFISEWKVNAGETLFFPIQGREGEIVVDWGDGSSDTISSGDDAYILHEYSKGGVYTIKVDGTIARWSCDLNIAEEDYDKVSSVTNMDKMFDQSGIDEDNYSAFVAGKVSKG